MQRMFANIENETIFLEIINEVQDAVYVVDSNRTIRFWNLSAEKLTGFSGSEVLGKTCADQLLNHVGTNGRELCKELCPICETMRSGKKQSASVFLHHKDGHRIPIDLITYPIVDEAGCICGAIEVFNSHAPENERTPQSANVLLQQRDELTGAFTKKNLIYSVSQNIALLNSGGFPFGVLFVDVDHFKKVNDTYGHIIGDKVLLMTANTLKAGLRSGDRVYRYGGEEFVVLLPGVYEEQHLKCIGEKLRALVESSFLIHDSGHVRVTISLGGTIACKHDTVDGLLGYADKLMYSAKNAGRNQSEVRVRV